MSEKNKSILLRGNEAMILGNYEGFLELCTEDTRWEFVGEQTITGKAALRKYLAETYIEPPRFDVKDLIAEGEFVIAAGEIELKESNGKWVKFDYCDVWRFREGKMADLRGFVIAKG